MHSYRVSFTGSMKLCVVADRGQLMVEGERDSLEPRFAVLRKCGRMVLMALSRVETTVVLSLACAVVMSTRRARAHDPESMIFGVYAPAGGHATLIPGYVSIIYYAANSDKPMPLGWVVPNLINSAGAASLGTLMITAVADSEPSTSRTWIMFNGAAMIAGGLSVTLGSILQRLRDERGANGSLVFLPMASVHCGEPLGGVVALGHF